MWIERFAFLCYLVCFVRLSRSENCLQFDSTGYLKFNSNLNVTDKAHYKLSFKTDRQDGTLFYAEGSHRDFERLYLSDGILNYFLYNPSPTGHGTSFGVHSQGYRFQNGQREQIRVSDNMWHTIEFFRNIKMSGQSQIKSGILIDGEHEDTEVGVRENVVITKPFYIGGTADFPNNRFKGYIKDFEEVRNDHKFKFDDTDAENFDVKLDPSC